jgi:FkbM family methyltransferase
MAFVSYAQNFEDVMLWRALKQVVDGFYIDVGAAWPDQDSVTKAFYERGWRGVNIEPNPDLCAELCRQRPRDVTLEIAISDSVGTRRFSIMTGTGLSSLNPEVARMAREAGFEERVAEVHTETLAGVWERHVPAGQPVHFLKVDVEGAERAVLAGNDWRVHRPWVVVVEATRPLSPIASHADWEPILLGAGYVMAYFDGLNRFYVAEEQPAVCEALRVPPNVFDVFVLACEAEAKQRAAHAEARLGDAEARLGDAEARYRSVVASRSWQITSPLRWAARLWWRRSRRP